MSETSRTLHNSIRVIVATTQEHLMHALYVRSICYMDYNGLKVGDAIDGNDFQCTHIVVYSGDEPIGSARVRWFQSFAKVEKTGFRKEYRHPHGIKRMGEFIFEHAARKGYSCIITTAKPDHARLWQRLFGFRPIEGKAFYQPGKQPGRDEPHIELIRDLTPPPDAISLDTDPQVRFRIEGAWDDATRMG